MGTCYIIGAGECNSLDFIKEEKDVIICADGGLKYAEKYGYIPDCIVGDFDSYGSTPSSLKNVIVLPKEKDETDSFYAVKMGFELGFEEFRLYGMLGGRIDHTLANIQLMMYIVDNGGNAVLIGNDYDVYLIKNGMFMFNGPKGKYISVFSYSPKSEGVTIKGLKYEVNNISFTNNNPLGVSNEFIGEIATVEVREGVLLVAVEK